MPGNESKVENKVKTENSSRIWLSLTHAYNYINNLGLKTFGGFWMNQYAGPIYPGIIPHKRASGLSAALFGHTTNIFAKKVGVFDKEDINKVRIIQDPKIREFAEKNDGICTFWIGPYPVIYVTDYKKSLQILKDEDTKIPLNEKLSGVPRADIQDILNSSTRHEALSSLMSQGPLFDTVKNAFDISNDYLQTKAGMKINLSQFIHTFVEYLESQMLFDFNKSPLSSYTEKPEYHEFLHDYLDNIIDIRMSQSKQAELAEQYVQFMIKMLRDNFETVVKNKNSIFKKLYELEKLEFPKHPDDFGKQGELEKCVLKRCLGIIAGASVNTSNALNWVIRHIENDPSVKEAIIKEAENAPNSFSNFGEIEEKLPYTFNVVQESLRFTPIVPGLGKLVEKPYSVTIDGTEIHLNRNTFILVDIIACNRKSENQFKDPNKFDVQNMLDVKKKQFSNGIFSTLNNVNAMRSFGGGNNQKAKCPGRFFSILLQAMIVSNLYKNYMVKSNEVSLNIKNLKSSQFHLLPEDKGEFSCVRRKL